MHFNRQLLRARPSLVGQAVEGLRQAWGCEVRWCRGPRIVPVADNYDRLGYAAEAITRDTRYTWYVDAGACRDADRLIVDRALTAIPRWITMTLRHPGPLAGGGPRP